MNPCRRFPQMLRLHDQGRGDEAQAHLTQCAQCTAEWADLQTLTALGRALPDGVPDAQSVASVRTRILAEVKAPQRRQPKQAWAWAAAIFVVALGSYFALEHEGSHAGQVRGGPDAHFTLGPAGPDERVLLEAGQITVKVDSLEPGQRFRVLTDDAEVEVRGTQFSVRAEGGRLQRVEVHEGLVEVRPVNGPAVRIGAGEHWSAQRARPTKRTVKRAPVRASKPPEPRSSLAVATPSDDPPGSVGALAITTKRPMPQTPARKPVGTPARKPVGTPARAPARTPSANGLRGSRPSRGAGPGPSTASTPSPRARAPGDNPPGALPTTAVVETSPEPGDQGPEAQGKTAPPPTREAAAGPAPPTVQTQRFEAGWLALRGGQPDEAIGFFAAAARLDGPLAVDAQWWHAVALGKASRDAAAQSALRAFMKAHPADGRITEAAVMLGWIYFSEGRIEAAEKAFRRGETATRAAVRDGASAGLEAVAKWRAAQP